MSPLRATAKSLLQSVMEARARTVYFGLMFRLKMRAIREKQGK